MSVEVFWDGFCRAHCVSGPIARTTSFGDGRAQQNELCALVLSGTKTATATLALWHGYERETAPKPGGFTIVLDGDMAPRCMIQTTEIFETAFCDVDAAFARDEGEGDGSLAYWRKEHRRFFAAELAREGLAFAETARVICERFRVVWAPS
jgi:uncharacterized protein YhfF